MKKVISFILIFSVMLVLIGCADEVVSVPVAKKELVVACGKNTTETLREVMQGFTTMSETTRVKLLEFSDDSVELHRVISSMLAGQEIQLDAMLIEDVWVAEFMKYNRLLPLGKTSEFDSASYPKGIEAFIGDEDNLYWYPIIMDIGIMYYREDITDGVVKLSELADTVGGEYALQGADGEEMLCCALEFINLAGSVRDGIELYKTALENSVSDGDKYITDFKDGKAVYMRSWASDSSDVLNDFSSVGGLVGADMMLREDGSSYATARAYGFAVNHATQNAENCIELLEYLKSDDVQMQILKEMGTLPLKREQYENPVILDYTNYTEKVAGLFDSLIFRPSRSDYTYASREARAALNDYILNNGSVDTAAAAIENLLKIEK